MYKVLGSDGNEYESISADKIKEWIRENRVEFKTPVMPEGAADWVFLGDLAEFKEGFAAAQKRRARKANRGGRRALKIGIGLLLAAVAVGIVVLILLKKAKYP